MPELSNLISAAVATRMTPEFIEKEINTRVEKLIVESVDRALRTYSETGKLIEKSIEDALRVHRLDLPSYGNVVSGILKAQIEAKVAPLVAGQLARDMEELLKLAPAEIKLSQIAADMIGRRDSDDYGEVITVIVEPTYYGSARIYLDDDQVLTRPDKYKCAYQLLLSKEGKIASATLKDLDIKTTKRIGTHYGLDQKIRAYHACGTVIIVDEDAVVTSVGDD